SSRRRHTRFSRDWSSDVCSSDLDQQDRERVLQTAGQRQEKGQLQDVVAEQPGGAALGQQRGRGKAQGQGEIDQRREPDRGEQRHQRQLELEREMYERDRERLADDRDPADQDQRAQAQPTLAVAGHLGERQGGRTQAGGYARAASPRRNGLDDPRLDLALELRQQRT